MTPPTFGYACHTAGDTIYHIEDACPDGSFIPDEQRIAGKGTGLVECIECRRIRDREGEKLKHSSPTFG